MRYETSFKELILGAEEEILPLIIGLNLKILEVKNVEFPQVREKELINSISPNTMVKNLSYI